MIKYVLSITVVTAMLYYCFAFNNVPSQPEPKSIPASIKHVFDDAILQAQSHDHYTKPAMTQQCEKQTLCNDYRALFIRYLSYKEALASLQKQLADLSLAEQLNYILAFQKQHFSDQEITQLFTTDNQYQAYSIERFAISQDDSLSAVHKSQMLENLDALQNDTIQGAINPTKQLMTLNTDLNDAFRTKNYNQLAGEFGDAAATRLIALQSKQQHWQKLTAELNQEITIIKQQLPSADVQPAISKLLNEKLDSKQQRRFLAAYAD